MKSKLSIKLPVRTNVFWTQWQILNYFTQNNLQVIGQSRRNMVRIVNHVNELFLIHGTHVYAQSCFNTPGQAVKKICIEFEMKRNKLKSVLCRIEPKFANNG